MSTDNPIAAFLARLSEGPLLADGAMGTQLYAHGVGFEKCFDALNLSDPELVTEVHRSYVAAGARLIETNTFGANAIRLAEHGLAERAAEIAEAGARIARSVADAHSMGAAATGAAGAGAGEYGVGELDSSHRTGAGERIWVAGSVGPLGVPIAPVGALDRGVAKAAFADAITGLVKGGVDLIIIETMGDLGEARLALEAARKVSDKPVCVLMTFGPEGRTASGATPEEVVADLEADGADVIGTNCSTGPAPMLEVVARMAAVATVPLAAMPNAGLPTLVAGRYIYSSSPDYVADRSARMVDAGVRLIGGCCGTGPQHISAIGAAISGARREPPRPSFPVLGPGPAVQAIPSELRGPTPLESILSERFATLVQIDPPRGFNISPLLPSLRRLRDSGIVDSLCLTDAAGARARVSALALSAVLRGEVGLPTVLQLGCAYRNLVATHSEILGAHALGARDILVVAGDLPANGDYPDATVVRDLNDIGLVRMIDGFNRGFDPEGRALEEQTAFHVGCEFDPAARDPERARTELKAKVDAGARFVISRPIFDSEDVLRARHSFGGSFPVPFIATVIPLWNVRHARYLHNEVPDLDIPDQVMERIAASIDARREGIVIACELVDALRDIVGGVQLVPPFGHIEHVESVVAEIAGSGMVPGRERVV